MKKTLLFFLCVLVLCLTACGQKGEKPSGDAATPTNTATPIEDGITPTEGEKQPDDTGEKVTPTEAIKPGPGGSEALSDESGFVCNRYAGRGFLTEDFALYRGDGGRLQYFDVASGTDIVFCFEPGCEHKPGKHSWDGKLIEKGCMAYEFSNYPVMLLGEKCYFLTDTGEVICSDRRGENRRTIGTIPPYILTDDVFFSDKALYVTYCSQYEMVEIKDEHGNSQWMIGDPKPTRACGILRVSLADGTCTEIFSMEDYSAYLPMYDIRGGHLYFQTSWMDIPYIGPDLVPNDPSTEIPEGLTVENYWDEIRKHMWMTIYDYNLATGELRPILRDQQAADLVFCDGFFAVSELDGKTRLYRYDGERFRELDFSMGVRAWSESGLICTVSGKIDEYMMIDENTGEVTKRVTLPDDSFYLIAVIGESCYGIIGSNTPGYLSKKDFWSGNTANAVAFTVQ